MGVQNVAEKLTQILFLCHFLIYLRHYIIPTPYKARLRSVVAAISSGRLRNLDASPQSSAAMVKSKAERDRRPWVRIRWDLDKNSFESKTRIRL